MKTKQIFILSIMLLSFGSYAHGDSGHDEPSPSQVKINQTDLFEATLATLQTFKTQNPELVSDYGAIRVRMGKVKGVESQIKTKKNGTFTFKCHRHEATEPFECHEAKIEI